MMNMKREQSAAILEKLPDGPLTIEELYKAGFPDRYAVRDAYAPDRHGF